MSEEEFMNQLSELQAYLFRAALAVLGSEADANDALQEAALRAYVSRQQLQGGAEKFKPWMKRILLHVCTDILKQRQRVIPLGGPDQLYSPAQEPISSRTEHEVWDHVAELPMDLREVVAMRYLFDLSQEQVARLQGIPVGTVKSRLNRALRQLRQKLIAGKDGADL